MKLTQETVDAAIYEGRSHMSKSGRKRWSRHVLWDDSLPGFGLRITPTNRKSFIVSYRSGGQKHTKSLGAADKLPLDEARRHAAELLASVDEQPREADGQPPIEGVATVAQLADAYLEQHLKDSVPSWYADQRLMQTHIKPAMGRSLLADVTRIDLANLRNRVAKSFPADARRLAALLGDMFDWAAGHGLWSESSGRDGAQAARRKAPARSADPTELRASLERAETERRELQARLDEVSANGGEMAAKLAEQAAELEELEEELALTRQELERARSAGADRPLHEKTAKQMANLRQSVDQLMASLREARAERRAMAEKLARVEAEDARRSQKTAKLLRRRNDLEAELLDKERRIAILRSQRRAGARRGALWLAAGAIGGALLTFAAVRALGPREPAATTAGTAAAPVPAAPVAAAPSVPDGVSPTEPTAAAVPVASPSTTASAGAPAGVPATEAGPDPGAVEAAVRGWAAAWSERRVDDYLAAYSERFTPPDGLGRPEWAAQRRDRILGPASIRVTLGELRQMPLGSDRVRVEFDQDYETETYADSVRKTLELAWEDGAWKIVLERAS